MTKKKHITDKAKVKPSSVFAQVSVRSIRAKMIQRQKDRDLMTTLPNGDPRSKYQTTSSGVRVIQEWGNAELQRIENMVDKMIDTTIEVGESVNDGIGNQSHKIHRLLGIWAERARNSEIEKARKEALKEIA